MPRKKIIYTHEFPYHVYARSNNREWFYIPLEDTWNIFVSEINRIFAIYKVSLHAFVLMSNHYHMLVTGSPEYQLGEVMRELQKSVSRRINKRAERSNHVFGGPYKASLVRSDDHYLEIFKYIYRNPVKAGIVPQAESYPYSSLHEKNPLVLESNGKVKFPLDLHLWLNKPSDDELNEKISRGLKKTEFRMSALRKY